MHRSTSIFETPTPAWGLYIAWTCDSKRVAELVEVAAQELEALQTNGPTSDELKLALSVQRRSLETRLQENQSWVTIIQDYLRLGVSLDCVTTP